MVFRKDSQWALYWWDVRRVSLLWYCQLPVGQKGRLMNTQFWAYFWQRWRSSIYQLFLFLSTTCNFLTILLLNWTGNCWDCPFEAMYRQIEQANSSGGNWRVGILRRDPRWNSVTWNVVDSWHPGENWSQEHQQFSFQPSETQLLSSMWNSVDLFRHRPCGPSLGWHRGPGRICKRHYRWSSVHLQRQERFLCAAFSKLPTQTEISFWNVGHALTLAEPHFLYRDWRKSQLDEQILKWF